MKQRLCKFFKSISTVDRIKFAVFILLNIAFCLLFYFIRIFIVALTPIGDLFPYRLHSNGIFAIRSYSPYAYKAADLFLLAFMQIWTAVLVKQLRLWLLSLPFQFALYFLAWSLLWREYWILGAQLILTILITQAIGVAVGLLVRWLIRKHRARKAAKAAQTPSL